jgi:hypothetical protein
MPIDQVARGAFHVFCDGCFDAGPRAESAEDAAARATAARWHHHVWQAAEGDADERWLCLRCAFACPRCCELLKGGAHAVA